MPSAPRADIREIPVAEPGSGPYQITTGPDGALWLTLVHSGQVARVTRPGAVDLYPLDPASCRPSGITTGPDGALWFTQLAAGRIGRITTSGQVMEAAALPAWRDDV